MSYLPYAWLYYVLVVVRFRRSLSRARRSIEPTTSTYYDYYYLPLRVLYLQKIEKY